MSFFYCNFAAVFYYALRRLKFFWEATSGEVSFKCGGVRTCWIASYALCFGQSKSGKFHKIFIQDIATLRCLWCILLYARVHACTLL